MRIDIKQKKDRESKIISLAFFSKKKITQKIIAKELNISVRTVKRYIKRYKKK